MMTHSNTQGEGGLVSQTMLAKIDRLREANLGPIIPLPQLVVVGDQSSGKSSVLESLTGFYFPRAAGLCTRYVTQISCCRDPQKSVVISIIPRPNANDELKDRLLQFRRTMVDMDNDLLARVFAEANVAMGIRMEDGGAFGALFDSDSATDAFSQDILKIEINGPEQNHLTVIDVPGIFRVATPGLTSESDIALVRAMVQQYMASARTIILAVIPCNVDINTQEILKLAEAADPAGVRTMGVMTKPDLATERATQSAVMDLVHGRRNPLRLGYHVVKNRGADDEDSTLHGRLAQEKAFFLSSPWSSSPERCGIPALKLRLGELLMQISKSEFPHVKSKINGKLRLRRAELMAMGPSRADPMAQRQYLGKLATNFQTVTQAALTGQYDTNRIFKDHEDLKLVTKVVNLNEAFSDVFAAKGHKHVFGKQKSDGDDEELLRRPGTGAIPPQLPIEDFPELFHILREEDYDCPDPNEPEIMEIVEKVFKSSRGPELGTFGSSVLATVFQEQSEKWDALVLQHSSRVIVIVHDYVIRLLRVLCPGDEVRSQLWDNILVQLLCEAYDRAMEKAVFLLNIERFGRPMTLNHYFNSNLQGKRHKRMVGTFEEVAIRDEDGAERVALKTLSACVSNKDNSQQVREDIFDTLTSYYEVARKRIVDVVCQQVVCHYLLEADDSPLRLFSPDLVMGLTDEQLEAIAGEDPESRHRRHALTREIESLELGMRILRS